MVGVVTLETAHGLYAHLSVQIAVLSVVFPHAGPPRVAPEVNHRGIRPRHATRPGLVSRHFGSAPHEVAVERCAHVDALRKECAVKRIGGAVDFIHAVDAGYSYLAQRLFLYAAYHFRPRKPVLRHAQRHVEQRADLVFAYHGVEHLLAKGKAVLALLKVGNHVDGDFAHLAYFLFKGHLAKPFLYAGLYFRVGRYRRRRLRHACEACSGAQRRSQCNVLKSVHIFICVIV